MKARHVFAAAAALAIAVLAFILWSGYQHQRDLELATAAELALQSGKYKREIEVLRKTAADLRTSIEQAPATSGATIRYITRYKDRVVVKEVSAATDMPADCLECLSAVEIPYHFESSYVVLDDVLRFNPDTMTFDSVDRKFELTDDFNAKLLRLGIENFVDEDTKILQARWGVAVSYGYNTGPEPLPGMGIGVALEFLNLKRVVGAEVGVNVSAIVVPQALSESHLFLAVDWRPFRNTAVGLGYGRSLGFNMVAAQLVFFPFD